MFTRPLVELRIRLVELPGSTLRSEGPAEKVKEDMGRRLRTSKSFTRGSG